MRGGFPVLLALFALGACGDDSGATADAAVNDGVVSDDQLVDASDPNMPATLAETGLCIDAGCTQIAAGIVPYTPRFQLYSDTAEKKRWIYLPPGTTINTTDMDFWEFPVGTKLWKEFIRDGVRVETRLVWRVASGTTNDWFYAAYVWNATQDATHWPQFGEMNANGTAHDVPGKSLCKQCHENYKPSRVLGFGALQLDFDGAAGELDLADLVSMNLLSAPPTIPGAGPVFPFQAGVHASVVPALGYMHANCGHCHNPSSSVQSNTLISLRLTVGTVGTIAQTPAYQTVVDVTTANTLNGHTKLVDPSSPSTSVLFDRFEATNGNRMPAAGTEDKDPVGETTLSDWITNIP